MYHRLKFTTQGDTVLAKRVTLDSIHARPERQTKKGKKNPARFDTDLLNVGLGEENGVQGEFHQLALCFSQCARKGYHVGQVQVIFTLPGSVDGISTQPLAYVEWFLKFTTPDDSHRIFKLNQSLEDGERVASIIPVSTIRRSVHLFHKFSPAVLEGWSSNNVLEKCATLYLNPLADRHMHFIL